MIDLDLDGKRVALVLDVKPAELWIGDSRPDGDEFMITVASVVDLKHHCKHFDYRKSGRGLNGETIVRFRLRRSYVCLRAVRSPLLGDFFDYAEVEDDQVH